MTIRRQITIDFLAEPQAVSAAVRSVLARNPPYRWTTESESESVFTTIVKPSWWFLDTDMTVELQPAHGGTTMEVKTESQWYILGDVFDLYHRLIRELASDVRQELELTNGRS